MLSLKTGVTLHFTHQKKQYDDRYTLAENSD
jgi:hypothetical protein